MAAEKLPRFVEKILQQISAERGFTSNSEIIVAAPTKTVLGANYSVTIKHTVESRELWLFIKCLLPKACCYSSEAEQYFDNEIILYGEILKYFLKLENARTKFLSSSLTCITKCLYVGRQDEPFIIMENLMKQGYVPLNAKQPVPVECVGLVLQQLGRFHAYSLAAKAQYPRQFENATSKLQETVFHPNVQVAYRKLFLHSIHDALKLVKENLPQDSVYTRKLSEFVLDIFNKMTRLAEGDAEDTHYKVVTHGDLWLNNMLYKHPDDKRLQPGDVAFVDFQGCRFSSPVHDLVFVMLVSVDQSTRERHREDLIRSYHRALCETVEQLGSDPLRLFPYSALQSQIRKHARFALAMALAGLPLYLDEGPRPSSLEPEPEPHTNSEQTLGMSIRLIHARKTMKCKNKMLEILIEAVNQEWL